MRLPALVACLATATCGHLRSTDPQLRPLASEPKDAGEVTTISNTVGSFQVRVENQADLEKLLAGEPTEQVYFAGDLF